MFDKTRQKNSCLQKISSELLSCQMKTMDMIIVMLKMTNYHDNVGDDDDAHDHAGRGQKSRLC